MGEHELDQILSEREVLNQQLQHIIDERTDPWGIKVSAVEIKDVDLPQEMQRAIARQAEAERERRAKVIHAEGEFQASEKLAAAAAVLGKEPNAIQLRYLSTVTEISSEHSNTILFPIPVNILEGLNRWSKANGPGKE
jgi:regulator of protease activity HflC (stomatin/prohibitin superfamily)